MEDTQKRSISLVVVGIAILGLYVAGYFGLSHRGGKYDEYKTRVFQSRWIATAYFPMALAEAKCIKNEVTILWPLKPPRRSPFPDNATTHGRQKFK